MSSMTATEKEKGTGKGLQATIAIVLMLLLLGGGGYGLYVAWTGNTGFGSSAVIGADDPPSAHPQWETMRIVRQAEQRTRELNKPDGFEPVPPNADPTLKAGAYRVYFTKRPNGDIFPKLWPMRIEEVITPDQSQVTRMRNRIITDKAVATFLKMTPEQMDALNKVNGGAGSMLMEPADKQKIVDLFKTYQSSSGQAKSDTEKQLASFVREVAAKSVEPTKKSVADRVAAIQGIVTKDQVAAFNKM